MTTNLCPKGHDKNIVGLSGRRCAQCKRDSNKEAARRRRANRKALPPVVVVPRVKPETDGLEALYGPVPDLVPDSEWYDYVIPDRVLSGRKAGRVPTPLEFKEIIQRMSPYFHVQSDLAELAGVSTQTFSDVKAAYSG